MRKKLLLTFTLFLVLLGSALAQERVITGKVTSTGDGLPLPGVNVIVSGTAIGTISDVSGKYSLRVPAGYKKIDFSFIGMKTETLELGATNVLDLAMVTSDAIMGEVVVTALGIKKEVKAIGFSQQEIGTKDLSGVREANLNNMLTAKVAGLQVSHTSSGMGGSSAITLRGAKSLLGNNQPLYVVDGIPITNINHNSGGTWNETDLGDGIGDINPEDVLSMEVLKGPNASALYGSRGANGVILITTKSGLKKKGIGVEINSNVTMETLNLFPTYQNYYANGYEETNIYGEMVTINGKQYETMDTWEGDSWGPPLDGRRTIVDPFVFPADANKKTLVLLPQPADNVQKFYNKGFSTSNTISISGGNDKTTARLSLGNTTMTGIIPNWKTNKQTILLKTSTEVNSFLSFDTKINYIRDEGTDRPALGTNSDNVTRTFVTLGRYVPLDFLKQYYETTKLPGNWPGCNYNPYYVVNELKNHDIKDRIIGLVSATVKFTPWLSLMGRTGIDYFQQRQDRQWPIGSFGIDNSSGRVTNDVNNVKDINADVLLTANKVLSSHFTMNASLGSSILYQERSEFTLDSRKFKAPGVYDVSNCQDIRPWDFLSKKKVESVYLSGEIAYNNFLFLDVTGRNDWSSALGVNNYSFFYPSVSTSFVFTDALKSLPKNILSFGKVRASWAQVGNDSRPYLTKNGYNTTTVTYAGQPLLSMNSTIPALNLKNELTTSWEVGADLRFLNSRIGVDLTYYDGKTTNQILEVGIPDASGYTTDVINAGEIRNHGIELALNLTPVKTPSGFSWEINANYSKNHSMVVSLYPGIETLPLSPGAYGDTEAKVGHPYGDIIGTAFQRAPDGQLLVTGGSYLPTTNTQVLGNITPKWIGGLNNIFSFKGLSLNVLLDFVQGNKIYSGTKYQEEAKGTGVWTTEGRRLHDIDPATGEQLPLVGVLPGVMAVTDADGNVSYVKNDVAVNGQTYWAMRPWGGIDEEFILDGSYISLREIVLSYNFSQAFISKTPFSGLSLSLIGRNLAYLEQHMQGMGISPESAPNTSAGYAGQEVISMPSTRTFQVNLKVTF